MQEQKQKNLPAVLPAGPTAAMVPSDQPQGIHLDPTPMLQKAGSLELSEKEMAILCAPVDDSMVQIRPHDGIIYLPWIEHHRRLRMALGTPWPLVPDGLPHISSDGKYIIWGFHLIVRGVYLDYVIGGQRYIEDNPQMSYPDAMAGAKSNALKLAGKALGIGHELYDPVYISRWKKEWAYTTTENGKRVWKRREIASAEDIPDNKPGEPEKPPESANGKTNGNGLPKDPTAIRRAYYAKRKEIFGKDQAAIKAFQQGLVDDGRVKSLDSRNWSENEMRNGIKFLVEYQDALLGKDDPEGKAAQSEKMQQIEAVLNSLEGQDVDVETLELYVKIRFLVPDASCAEAEILNFLQTIAAPEQHDALEAALAKTSAWWETIPESKRPDIFSCIGGLNRAAFDAGGDEEGKKLFAAFFESMGIQPDELGLYMLDNMTAGQLANYRKILEQVCGDLGIEFTCDDTPY